MRRLILVGLALAALCSGCGFPPSDGQVHLGGGVSVTRPHDHLQCFIPEGCDHKKER